MPGLLAVSWAPERADRAAASLARVVRAFTALRGMAPTAEAAGPTCRVVRFAGAGSPHPALVTSPDGQVTVAAAGWCFAAEAAVAADGVLPHLAIRFAAVGDAALDGLQGQYLALAMDRRDGRLVAAPDQLGLFPVYVAEDDGVAWVTTAALPLAVGLGARLDVEALRALFMESAIRSPRSAFAGIRRASFGERVTITAGRAHVARRWLPYRAARAYRRIEDAADEGGGLLRATARKVRAAWPAWVADLTSGLDSRLVVAALAEPGAPVHVTVNGPDDHLDVAIARLIADRFGWSLEHVSLPPDWGGRRWPLFEEGVALADGELGGHAIDGTLYAKRRLAGRFAASRLARAACHRRAARVGGGRAVAVPPRRPARAPHDHAHAPDARRAAHVLRRLGGADPPHAAGARDPLRGGCGRASGPEARADDGAPPDLH